MKMFLLMVFISIVRINGQSVLRDTSKIAGDTVNTAKDSVNISQLVQEQINRVRDNEKKLSEKPAEVQSGWGTQNPEISSVLKYKLASILLAVIISVLYIFLRRKKLNNRKGKVSLKKNISALRIEKPVLTGSNELSVIRTNLRKNAVYLSIYDKEISKSAKELNIAKGELYLAAVLKSHELTKIGNRKINLIGLK
jgi:hypothetical protein